MVDFNFVLSQSRSDSLDFLVAFAFMIALLASCVIGAVDWLVEFSWMQRNLK